ncbi:PPE domain-containing protein [Umezawaea endophytica]|uniref:PPE domain-containing protein n=1 Tax=Umezawaea endophytica TaxID=1654476 RepID=A0A9X3A458_9PSEU|nr:PPE domain-containing protein [Umezawaea endophytica]MCS7480853.1 PPE domain-containing protein [Umezawaea endophytica]
MGNYKDIADHRFEGYDNPALAQLVTKFKSGDGAQRFNEASHALRTLAKSLADTDEVLRTELRKLGITWQGAAGENAGKTITAEADYADQSVESGQQNAQATAVQSASYSDSRDGMPEPDKLRGDTETSLVDDVGGFFGYETDHAQEVKETNAAREQTIRGLTQYTEASRDALNQFQVPGQPPNFEVTSTSATVGAPVGTGIPGIGSPTPGIPGGGSVGSPVGGVGGVPGGGVLPPPQPPGGGTPLPPGGGTQLPPGGGTGVLPPGIGTVVNPPAAAGLSRGGGFGPGLGIGLGLAGAAGLGAVAAGAKGAQVIRGAGGPGTGAAPKVPVVKPGVPGVGGNGTIGGAGKSGVAGVPVDGDERANRGTGAAGAGGRGVRGGAGAMMQPAAAAGRGAEGDEDDEHVRKYGVDSDDVFGDDRMVVQSVIGEEPQNK